jgi:hypothetical protein
MIWQDIQKMHSYSTIGVDDASKMLQCHICAQCLVKKSDLQKHITLFHACMYTDWHCWEEN